MPANHAAAWRIVLGAVALAAAGLLAWQRVAPVPTWLYVFAWYPTLLILDGLASLRGRHPSLLAHPALAASLLAWSPVVWLAYEAANFRLQNWYYVMLPGHPVERWAGIVLSFATVLPAVVLAERALDALRVFAARRTRPLHVRAWHLRASAGIGVAAIALALWRPTLFYPVIWGAGLFLVEPLVYRRAPALSLLRDLERGEWGRAGRLLLGGLAIGILWEGYNHLAEAGWIYTVPGLERLKIFEMPPLGFLGFPVFALSAWALYAALCALGVAAPVTGPPTPRGRRSVAAGALAAAFVVITLAGMERYTVSSTALSPSAAAALPSRTAELAGLRGLGLAHAETLQTLGFRAVCDLAGRDGQALADAVRRARPGVRPTAAEARVWIRGAERACR